MDPIQLSRTKCMFIKSTKNHIYITDLGNGWILYTDMNRGTTRYVKFQLFSKFSLPISENWSLSLKAIWDHS